MGGGGSFSMCPSPDFLSSLVESSEVGANLSALPRQRSSAACRVSGCVIAVVKPTLFLLEHIPGRSCGKYNNGLFLLHSVIYDSNRPLNDFAGLRRLELFWSSGTQVETAGANQL